MRVSIHFSILSELKSIKSLQQNALQAWEARTPGSVSTRVLQELRSEQAGRYFRFYEVTLHQDDPSCVIVR